jgi:hypothetical protein
VGKARLGNISPSHPGQQQSLSLLWTESRKPTDVTNKACQGPRNSAKRAWIPSPRGQVLFHLTASPVCLGFVFDGTQSTTWRQTLQNWTERRPVAFRNYCTPDSLRRNIVLFHVVPIRCRSSTLSPAPRVSVSPWFRKPAEGQRKN